MGSKPYFGRKLFDRLRRSSGKDFPPKRKKPYKMMNREGDVFSFPEMEHYHHESFDLPIGYIPPFSVPDCYSDCVASCEGEGCDEACTEACEEFPTVCGGHRNLWVEVRPLSVDCAEDKGFTLIISPDFQCVSVRQVLVSPNDPILAPGQRELESSCESDPSERVFFAVCDCECGGCSVVGLPVENCNVDCGEVFIDCQNIDQDGACTTLIKDAIDNYFLVGASNTGTWSSDNENVIAITSGGAATAVGTECESTTLRGVDECCGEKTISVEIPCTVGDTGCGFWDTSQRVTECEGSTISPQESCIFEGRRYTNWQGVACSNPCNSGNKGKVVSDPWVCL